MSKSQVHDSDTIKNMQNKALMLPEMCISSNIKFENWQKDKKVATQNECNYNKHMDLISVRHSCKELAP